MSDSTRLEESYSRAITQVGSAALDWAQAFEQVQRRLHPPAIAALRERLAPLAGRVREGLAAFEAAIPPEELADFHAQLAEAARHAAAGVEVWSGDPPPGSEIAAVLQSFRHHCRLQEALYPLRSALPPVNRYFAEPPLHESLATLDPAPAEGGSVGLHRSGGAEERGHFHLYVPEWYTPERAWPLVVALHGGMGHGRDFLWTWLREARSRGALVLAPSSVGTTWSFDPPDVDARRLAAMVSWVSERWTIDPARVLLTGLSDGATFSLLAGLGAEAPYTALAPVSGVLHPANFTNGNLGRAAGRRIYLVHGALDWMFPATLARAARDALRDAGAELSYREIEDLSHTYPREENGRILRWLDPALALAGEA